MEDGDHMGELEVSGQSESRIEVVRHREWGNRECRGIAGPCEDKVLFPALRVGGEGYSVRSDVTKKSINSGATSLGGC